jgi:hypothetical protein
VSDRPHATVQGSVTTRPHLRARARAQLAWAAGCGLLGALAACGGAPLPRPVGAAAVTVAAGSLPDGPEPTFRALPIPTLDEPWEPPSAIAGDMGALADALRGSARIAVQLGPRLDGELWRRRIPGQLAALGAGGAITFENADAIAHAFAKPPALRSLAQPSNGFADLELDAGWRTKQRGVAPAGTLVLAIDDAPIDEASWRALPAAALGSCDAPMAALALGQERSLAELEPFLDHADAILWQLWRAELRTLLPRVRDSLEAHAAPRTRAQFPDEAAWREHECGQALWQFVERYHQCIGADRPCELSPRLLLVGGARIAAPEPAVFVPDGCVQILGQDVVEQVRGFGRDAAEAASDRLDPQWVTLSDRLGAVTEVHAALDDVCEPRRRRFAAGDLADARARLIEIGDALASDELPRAGGWSFEPGSFHVPGTGAVVQLAAYDAGLGSPSRAAVAGARALRQFVLARALCRSGAPNKPLALLLVDPHAGGVRHFGYVYEEELACGTLPPLGAPGAPQASEPSAAATH